MSLPAVPIPSADPAGYAAMISGALRRWSPTRPFQLPGQHLGAFPEPAEAISAFYWRQDSPAAHDLVVSGLIDVLGVRADALPPEALGEVVFAIGLIQRPELLLPMAKRVGQQSVARAGTEDAAALRGVHGLFRRALMVLKGAGESSTVVKAARELAGARAFPNDLVYDVVELCLGDTEMLWSEHVLALQPQMDQHLKFLNREGSDSWVPQRLARTARLAAEKLSICDLARGFEQLLALDLELFRGQPLTARRDAIGIFAQQALAVGNSPLRVAFMPFVWRWRLEHRGGGAGEPLANSSELVSAVLGRQMRSDETEASAAAAATGDEQPLPVFLGA